MVRVMVLCAENSTDPRNVGTGDESRKYVLPNDKGVIQRFL